MPDMLKELAILAGYIPDWLWQAWLLMHVSIIVHELGHAAMKIWFRELRVEAITFSSPPFPIPIWFKPVMLYVGLLPFRGRVKFDYGKVRGWRYCRMVWVTTLGGPLATFMLCGIAAVMLWLRHEWLFTWAVLFADNLVRGIWNMRPVISPTFTSDGYVLFSDFYQWWRRTDRWLEDDETE